MRSYVYPGSASSWSISSHQLSPSPTLIDHGGIACMLVSRHAGSMQGFKAFYKSSLSWCAFDLS